MWEILCLSPRETASNQDEWPRPVASPGILTDNLRHSSPFFYQRPSHFALRFWAKPQLSSVFVIKRNYQRGLNLICVSLLRTKLAKCHGNQSPVFAPWSTRLGYGDNLPQDIRGFLASSSILSVIAMQYVKSLCPVADGDNRICQDLETHFRKGKKRKWANQHADASVGSIFTFVR